MFATYQKLLYALSMSLNMPHCMPMEALMCRRTISEIKQQFPGVDFSLIESDEDVLWERDEREQHTSMRVSCGQTRCRTASM